jgi:hypothetical protein
LADKKVSDGTVRPAVDLTGDDVVEIEVEGEAVQYKVKMSDLAEFVLTNLNLIARSSDPADPPEGRGVPWISDGTESGDSGDVLLKVTAGGATKIVTLLDFSAV